VRAGRNSEPRESPRAGWAASACRASVGGRRAAHRSEAPVGYEDPRCSRVDPETCSRPAHPCHNNEQDGAHHSVRRQRLWERRFRAIQGVPAHRPAAPARRIPRRIWKLSGWPDQARATMECSRWHVPHHPLATIARTRILSGFSGFSNVDPGMRPLPFPEKAVVAGEERGASRSLPSQTSCWGARWGIEVCEGSVRCCRLGEGVCG